MKTLVRITFALMIFMMTVSVSYSQNDTTKRSTSEAFDRDRDVDLNTDKDRDNTRDRNADSRIKDIGADNDMTKGEDNDDHAFIKDMHEMMEDVNKLDLTGDFDLDFAKVMIEHHEGAIDMARTENSKGENDELKKLAEATIDKSQGDIDILKDFVDDYKESGKKHDVSILKNSLQKDMTEMHSMDMTGNWDQDFARMMSAHHAHAIELAKLELEHGVSPTLKDMAKLIIDNNEKEISKLKDWSSRQK